MNWFQRYGFPGAFFFGVVGLWLSLIYPEQFFGFLHSAKHFTTPLAAAAVASALPIGYLLSVIGQVIYLKWCGAHTAARCSLGLPALCEEGTLEVLSVTQITTGQRIPMDRRRFLQEWIARRMDVMAISSSSLLGAVLGSFVGGLMPYVLGWRPPLPLLSLGIALAVFLVVSFVLCVGFRRTRAQVVQVLAEEYAYALSEFHHEPAERRYPKSVSLGMEKIQDQMRADLGLGPEWHLIWTGSHTLPDVVHLCGGQYGPIGAYTGESRRLRFESAPGPRFEVAYCGRCRVVWVRSRPAGRDSAPTTR